MENVVIIGSGPSGLTAAIYSARAALSPVVIGGMQPGGQLTTTSVIENWPGFVDGIDGNKLMRDMREQAEKVGARMLNGSVSKVERSNKGTFIIKRDYEPDLEAKVVIIATGASAITLPLPNKDKLMGYGLSTCAVCDGFFYKNKKVAVVGGGDSAMEEAMYLSKLAAEVILIHRSDKFRASKAMQERVVANPKIKIIYNTEIIDTISDDKGLTGIVAKNKNGTKDNITVDGLFMAIGHHPNTDFVKGLVDMDEKGYILTKNGTYTNIEGIFAAGDVEDKLYRQAITAAGRGCQAALQAEKYIEGFAH
ncbi:thioredoxin-disulfide reductase [Pigmentibacter sp. JX0631]|uniref:thioredoxin-disulfide reductase n=1 Tax=Pigmentibacter sp. JX0631 TaxID=2976982 RepID=UPI002468894D|nr:thioredoxin-disulfide reductase [Pigmentibacter sp. JX0631]WGL61135.1 thioredoxin-disulfide reductase [Pigmentibacter sp. JX0631]